jgi:hypothetical protein
MHYLTPAKHHDHSYNHYGPRCLRVMHAYHQLPSRQCSARARIMELHSMDLYRTLQGGGQRPQRSAHLHEVRRAHRHLHLHHHITNTTGSGGAEDDVFVTAPVANYVPLIALLRQLVFEELLLTCG